MTGIEHYQAAEALIANPSFTYTQMPDGTFTTTPDPSTYPLAQVHATLALVAAVSGVAERSLLRLVQP